MSYIIRLDSVEAAKKFHAAASSVPNAVCVMLKSGRFIVDGKSIMGIFSLDLTRNLCMEIDPEHSLSRPEIYDKFGEWIEREDNDMKGEVV